MRALRTKSRLLFGVYLSRGILVAALTAATILTLFAGSSTKSSNQIDQVLREAVDEKKVPGIVAMVAVADHVIYQGAAGKRNTIKNIPMPCPVPYRFPRFVSRLFVDLCGSLWNFGLFTARI